MSKKKDNDGRETRADDKSKPNPASQPEAKPTDAKAETKPVEAKKPSPTPAASAQAAPDQSMTVNGQKVPFEKGDTILSACQRVNIHIPTLCYLEGFSPTGSCRFCVVEVDGRPALIPSCTYPAEQAWSSRLTAREWWKLGAP